MKDWCINGLSLNLGLIFFKKEKKMNRKMQDSQSVGMGPATQ